MTRMSYGHSASKLVCLLKMFSTIGQLLDRFRHNKACTVFSHLGAQRAIGNDSIEVVCLAAAEVIDLARNAPKVHRSDSSLEKRMAKGGLRSGPSSKLRVLHYTLVRESCYTIARSNNVGSGWHGFIGRCSDCTN
ncbi:hypothetical protein LIER_10156 [Lithospermum erythrorhizon]|uniref:Uncharacterized protein n=1 Tax=Lithospermum erythrorhizon TaxID=34254 RepID=A0AAV3PIF3_LITER